MIHDLIKSARDLLLASAHETNGPSALLTKLTDLLFYGDFEILEQAASFSDTDHTNIVGFKPGRRSEGGLLLCASLGVEDGPPPDDRPGMGGVTVRDGRIEGPGVNAGRLALLCQLAAASRVPRDALVRPLMVAGVFGAEHRDSGARYLLESGHVQPHWTIVGAATNLEVIRCHRGYLIFEIELSQTGDRAWRTSPARTGFRLSVPGLSVTSVFAGAGTSALARALALSAELSEDPRVTIHGLTAGPAVNRVPGFATLDVLSQSRELPPLPHDVAVSPLGDDARLAPPQRELHAAWSRFEDHLRAEVARRPYLDSPVLSPTVPLLNVGTVETTAGGLRVRFDYRPVPGENPYSVFELAGAVAKRTEAELCTGVGFEVRVTSNRPAMELPETSELTTATCDALSRAGILPVVAAAHGYTEGAMFASCDIDTVVFGPGHAADGACAPTQSVPIRHLEIAADVYESIIKKLCV